MDDQQIITMYHKRDQKAITETKQKYHGLLQGIAYRILFDREDGEECVNDTYLEAWNAMPPHKPHYLSAFLAKITRALSIDRLRYRTAHKRGGSEYILSLEEIGSLVSGTESAEETLDGILLKDSIEAYLLSCPPSKADIFICRYFYFYSIGEIAKRHSLTQSNVKSILYRLRQGLRDHLIKEGFTL